jgi:uncharacterized damage-inducible protein DinB
MNRALVEMFRYNAWANEQLFQACRSVTEVHSEARVAGSARSARDLLMHIADGERTLVMRTQGTQPDQPVWADWPGMDEVIDVVVQASQDLIAIAEQLDDEDDAQLDFRGKSYRFPKRFFLVHAMEHSAEHRTELKVLLSGEGIETPDLDGWHYASAVGYGTEVVPS